MQSRQDHKPRFLVFHPDAAARRRMRLSLERQFGVPTATEVESEAALLSVDLPQFDLIFLDDAAHIAPDSRLIAQIRQRCCVPVVLMCDPARPSRQALAEARNAACGAGELPLAPMTAEASTTGAAPGCHARTENGYVSELEQRMQLLIRKNENLERSLAQVEETAATDPLTGLSNRRHFEIALSQRVSEALRYDQDLSCVMIDLDGYKQFNDTFGHPMGDRLLTIVGKVIAANLRAMDTAARYGGDEFVLLLPQSIATEAHHVASRISKAFTSASALLLRQPSGVTMSIGIASIRCAGVSNCEQLVSAADRALYVAKHAGRNRVVISEPACT